MDAQMALRGVYMSLKAQQRAYVELRKHYLQDPGEREMEKKRGLEEAGHRGTTKRHGTTS